MDIESDREGHPNIHRPPCPCRVAGSAGPPRLELALVVEQGDARTVRVDGPGPVGADRREPRAHARRARSGATRRARGRRGVRRARARRGRAAGCLPRRRPLVPAPGGREAERHRVLLAGVRCRRLAPPVLRRSRHPGRRPPQERLRPRRAAHRRRPVLPGRLLPPVDRRRRLAARELPAARPVRSRPDTAARCRRVRPSRSPSTLPGDRQLHARVWVADIGRIPLLLLDSETPSNSEEMRRVTDRLYGGGGEHRLLQELLLGVGGVRAVRAWSERHRPAGARGLPHERGPRRVPGPRADVGAHHAGRPRRSTRPSPRCAPRRCSRRTHRCRPASTASRATSSRTSSRAACSRAWKRGARSRSASRPTRAATRACSTWPCSVCTSASTRTASRCCTARSAAECSVQLWPGVDTDEVPITSITNGVHAPTWVHPALKGAQRARLRRRAHRHARLDRSRRRQRRRAVGRALADEERTGGRGAAPGGGIRSGQNGSERRAGMDRPICSTPKCSRSASPAACRPTSASPDAARPGAAHEAADRPRAPGADRDRRQVAPGRRLGQDPDPAAGALQPRPEGARADRVPARLRHHARQDPVPGLRRVAQQPAAPARGVRHERHEGRAQRRAEPVDPRRLVG